MSDYSIVGDEVREVEAGSVVRVPPQTVRSHRNLGDEPVELWAVSRKIEESDSEKVEDFWDASPKSSQSAE
jgi:quercetin dioxygenase-like cupin family protein